MFVSASIFWSSNLSNKFCSGFTFLQFIVTNLSTSLHLLFLIPQPLFINLINSLHFLILSCVAGLSSFQTLLNSAFCSAAGGIGIEKVAGESEGGNVIMCLFKSTFRDKAYTCSGRIPRHTHDSGLKFRHQSHFFKSKTCKGCKGPCR